MRGRLLIVSILILAMTASALAAQSAEQIVVRVSNYDANTRAYTFTCDVPSGAGTHRYWTIRPDTPDLEASFYTDTRDMTFTLDKDVMYHIGCQVPDASGTYIRGDFHIDRRTQPNQYKPNIVAQSTSGTQFTMTCTPPPGTTNYNLFWRLINNNDNIALTQFNNQNTITTNVPYPGLWDVTCGSWDNSKQAWTQWGFPTEFFSSGQAYTPRIDGCIPGEPCPWGAGGTSNTTNTTNTTTNTTNSTSTNTTNTTNTTTTGNATNACYSSVQGIPASCQGGSITTDSWNGCRTLVCSSGASSLQTLACDKAGYFELYRQTQIGSGTFNICIGTTCLGNNGYVRSGNFPICTASNTTNSTNTTTGTNSTNSTNSTNTTGTTNAVAVSIAPWYPQGHNYVFRCDASGFTPSSYSWSFGDGSAQYGMTSNNVYHTFMSVGVYNVVCTAKSGGVQQSGALQVDVQ